MTLLKMALLSSLSCLTLTACNTEKEAAEPLTVEDYVAAMNNAKVEALKTTGPGQPALWSYADEDTVVYLLGTIHLLKPDTQWRSETLNAAFKSADTLYLEVDQSSPESQVTTMKLVTERGMFGEGETLAGVLDEAQEKALTDTLSPMGATIDAVNTMKPWLLGLQLTVGGIVQAGYDPTKGVDAVLATEAKGDDMRLKYLETVERQINMISGAPMDEQVEGLMINLATLDLGVEFVDVLAAEWADGDVKGLAATMADPIIFGSQDGYEDMMVSRNREWIPALKSALDEPGTKFVAVGAGHLVGPDSVIAMLADEGIKAERVQ